MRRLKKENRYPFMSPWGKEEIFADRKQDIILLPDILFAMLRKLLLSDPCFCQNCSSYVNYIYVL